MAAVIAGEACALIHDIPTAGEIVERIVAQAERVLRGPAVAQPERAPGATQPTASQP